MSQTAAKTFRITDGIWALRAENLEQRNELIAYARLKKVPMGPRVGLDRFSLDLGAIAGELIDYNGVEPSVGWTLPDQFRAMCDAYAASRR